MRCTVETWLDDDTTVTVECYYTPGRAGCNYLRSGDPGYPDEPAELEITSITDEAGKPVEVSDKVYEELRLRVWDEVEDIWRQEMEEARISRREYEL